MAFQYERYVDPTIGTIRDLMLRQGDIRAQQAIAVGNAQARAGEQSGNAWAGAAGTVGQAIAGIPAQIAQGRKQEQEAELFKLKSAESAQALKSGGIDVANKERAQAATTSLANLMRDTPKTLEDGTSVWDTGTITKQMAADGFGPEAGQVAGHLETINNGFRQAAATRRKVVQDGAAAIAAAGNDPTLANEFMDQLEANSLYPKDTVDKFRAFVAADPGNVAKLTTYLAGPQKFERGAPGSVAVNPLTGIPVPGSGVPEDPNKGDYTINGQRFAADGTPKGALVPPQTAPKSIDAKNVLLDGRPAIVNFDPATGKHLLPDGTDVSTRVRPIPPAAAQGDGGAALADAKDIAAAIRRGEQPPDLKGLYRQTAPVEAELARAGYNLTNARLDWEATQKHVAALNGVKVTSLMSAVTTAQESIPVIRDLAAQWDAGGWSDLNKANLYAAQKGAYGEKAASIATKLIGQITDVTSELGQVYMGGNSPTDHALDLAGKNLKAEWSKKVLFDMLDLADTNLTIRRNSYTNSRPMGTSATNPYAPPVAPAPVTVVSPKGKPYTFASQAEADKAIAAAKAKGLW